MSKPGKQTNERSEAVGRGSPTGGGWSSPVFVCLLLAVVTLAAFGRAVWECGFTNYDDDLYVARNAYVQQGLTWANVRWALGAFDASNWHPLTWLSHMLDMQVYGLRPWGHHLTNVLLHTANAVLLFLLLKRMTGARWRSALVAALFALHPLRVESVAWLAERKDVLSAFFGLLSLLFYVRYAQTHMHPASRIPHLASRNSYLASLIFFACGLMSKPMLVTWPLLLLLLDYWPLNRISEFGIRNSESRRAVAPSQRVGLWTSDFLPRRNEVKAGGLWTSVWRRLVREKIPFFVLSLASCVITFIAQAKGKAVPTFAQLPLDERMGNAVVSYARYLGKMFWPVGLAVPYPHLGHWPATAVVAGIGLLAGLSALVVWQGRRRPYLFVGWFWFVGMLLPVIGLVQVGGQSMADRYTYMPSVGVFLAAVWGLAEARLWQRLPSVVGAALGAGVLMLCMIQTFVQLGFWQDSETLFRHTLAVTKTNFVAYDNLAHHLFEQGRFREAIVYGRQAVEIVPGSAAVRSNLGACLYMEGKLDEAVAQFREALRLNPEDPGARENLAIILVVQGKYDEAVAQYIKLLRVTPGEAFPYHNLGDALRLAGRLDEAVVQFRKALRLKPELLEAHRNLAATLAAQGNYTDAIAQYTEVLRLAPDDWEAQYHLSVLFEQTGRLNEAVQLCQQAIRAWPDNAEAHQRLGELFARVGDKASAVAQWRTVVRLKPDWPPALDCLAWLLATDQDAAWRDGKEAVMFGERAARATTNGSPEVLHTLAAAYAESGRFAEAVETAQRAIDLAVGAGKEKLAEEIRRRLEQYQAGRPERE